MTANRLDSSTPPGNGLPPLPESWLPREHPLHRPRHGIRQRSARVAALVFFCVPMLLLVVGVRAPEFENRKLAGFPSITDGFGLFTGLDQWATDHLPLRDKAVLAEDAISRDLFGEPPALGEKPNVAGPVQAPVQTPSASDEDRDKLRASGFPKVIEGSNGWLYLGYDVLGACLPQRPIDDVIGGMKKLREAVESSGRTFILVVAPDKTTMAPEHLPADYVGKACSTEARDNFWKRAVADAGVLDVRPALRTAGESAPVYSALDTHWTHDGALAMARLIAEKVQAGSTATWKVTPGNVVQREGDLSTLLGKPAEFPLQTYDLAPDGLTVQSKVVDKAFRDPLKLPSATGKGVVQAKVSMVADSFTLPAVPYLSGGFADLTVIHSDTAGTDIAKVVSTLADSDVVVFEAVERSLTAGINPMVSDSVVNEVKAGLAKRPR
ncbi:MAG: hypothetical protein ABIQ18_38010 [Umezawaea sp.]